IDTPRELETLGLDDLAAEDSVLLVEWGDKFARFERARDVEIVLERISENERRVRITTPQADGYAVSPGSSPNF
ncbi:MAG TPA: hypothetical protein VKB77_12655, partial [Terriglobales bacterium]|nr:hypothetical protein [Terriglobales bacterium]